jgi:succinate dehydrogenase/fumarate reductase flavoprotein subunit
MENDILTSSFLGKDTKFKIHKVHTLVIGSGAAGLNASIQLHVNGIRDALIITEGLQMGTSINTGSDKQTYYKLSMCGADDDSPQALAEALYAGGSMHGDLALVEASLSARAFMGLVNLGVPFPRDRFGQFVGYKTDHDPRQRATSVGPYTSREMCRLMIEEIRRREIPVHEKRVAVSLLVADEHGQRRAVGAIALNMEKEAKSKDDWPAAFEIYEAENVIFAVGGPGGLYKTSVYPQIHTGAIGLALLKGAMAQNLNESQFGMSSIKFRWNVSGTYMQCIPRIISTTGDGISQEREFLASYFANQGELHSLIFLKGYQWPFHALKVVGGSSIIDILVYNETVVKGRRVFLDFRRNPTEFNFGNLRSEASEYLKNSKALDDSPLKRLQAMNPEAIMLYKDHGIDITKEPLEIAVCAQHNNGGLAANLWWESENIKHLFPVGEVNGSHGVTRPGGAALNAGQVGGYRAAEYITNIYDKRTLIPKSVEESARKALRDLSDWIENARESKSTWQKQREELQIRMTRAGAHIRSLEVLRPALREAWQQWRTLKARGNRLDNLQDLAEGFRNLQLCYAHVVYLETILYSIAGGLGSRGSALVLDKKGELASEHLGDDWRFTPENAEFRARVLQTIPDPEGEITHQWIERRPLPQSDTWFETAWAAFLEKEIYK